MIEPQRIDGHAYVVTPTDSRQTITFKEGRNDGFNENVNAVFTNLSTEAVFVKTSTKDDEDIVFPSESDDFVIGKVVGPNTTLTYAISNRDALYIHTIQETAGTGDLHVSIAPGV